MTIAGTSCSPRRVGSASSPSRTNSPIWAIQPSALAKLWNATRLGSPMLPSTSAARYVARKPETCRAAPTAYASTVSATTPIEKSAEDAPATRCSTWPPSQPTAPPTIDATGELDRRVQDEHPPRVGRAAGHALGREGDDEDDDRGVVEAGLGLEHPRQPLGQRHVAQDGEDRRRVGRGDDGAHEQRDRPRQRQQRVRRHGDDEHRHDDARASRAPLPARPSP